MDAVSEYSTLATLSFYEPDNGFKEQLVEVALLYKKAEIGEDRVKQIKLEETRKFIPINPSSSSVTVLPSI